MMGTAVAESKEQRARGRFRPKDPGPGNWPMREESPFVSAIFEYALRESERQADDRAAKRCRRIKSVKISPLE
jgi:hypothetical protein